MRRINHYVILQGNEHEALATAVMDYLRNNPNAQPLGGPVAWTWHQTEGNHTYGSHLLLQAMVTYHPD